jgi:hypothetical protein
MKLGSFHEDAAIRYSARLPLRTRSGLNTLSKLMKGSVY